MENFEKLFYNLISKKVGNQIKAIDKICSDLEILPNEWFKNFLNRNANDYSGADFMNELLSDFVFYLSREFQKSLLKYIEPEGYNIYKEPYLTLSLNLKYDLTTGFHVKEKNKKKFRKTVKNLTLTQRQDLMTNKIFSHIVNQTNLEIFTKKEMRTLKLKRLNECITNTTE